MELNNNTSHSFDYPTSLPRKANTKLPVIVPGIALDSLSTITETDKTIDDNLDSDKMVEERMQPNQSYRRRRLFPPSLPNVVLLPDRGSHYRGRDGYFYSTPSGPEATAESDLTVRNSFHRKALRTPESVKPPPATPLTNFSPESVVKTTIDLPLLLNGTRLKEPRVSAKVETLPVRTTEKTESPFFNTPKQADLNEYIQPTSRTSRKGYIWNSVSDSMVDKEKHQVILAPITLPRKFRYADILDKEYVKAISEQQARMLAPYLRPGRKWPHPQFPREEFLKNDKLNVLGKRTRIAPPKPEHSIPLRPTPQLSDRVPSEIHPPSLYSSISYSTS